MKKVLFITPYPKEAAPSQRFRFEQYLDILEANDYQIELAPFIDLETWHLLYDSGSSFKKMLGVAKGFIKRFFLVFRIGSTDHILIHREATPIGPPIFEWVATQIYKKKIIYDFDDAIWLPNTSEQNSLAAKLKFHHKVGKICKWAHKVSAGNEYLASYAKQFNSNVVINPTTIDTENLHNPKLLSSKSKIGNLKLTIGWTGTHSTLKYLDPIFPILDQLTEQFDFTLLVISNLPPVTERNYLKFIKWSKETEIEDLTTFDIGIMPLTDDRWARGKCGFKALQYLALETPAIISPVGVNTQIVSHGKSGYLCSTDEEWELAIKSFLENPELIKKMGTEGRKHVVANYSVLSNTQNFLSLFY